MPNHKLRYLIWSNEHQAWWGSAHVGYFSVISRAGRYTLAQATAICDDANIAIPEGDEPHEVMVLAPECLKLNSE